jgi:hypothetical protein
LLIPKAFDIDTTPVVAEKQQQEAHNTTNTTNTTEKERKKFSENWEDRKDRSDSKKESKDIGGIGGICGISNVLDSGFSDTNALPQKKEAVASSSVDRNWQGCSQTMF